MIRPSSASPETGGRGQATTSSLPRDGEMGALPSTPVIQVRGVHKEFVGVRGTVQRVLSGIDLDIHKGEFICLLGPSGCGKSTLLNLVAGFDMPSAGTILAYGQRVTGPSRERVVVFQDAGAALFPWRTVRENVDYALRFRGVEPASARKAQIDGLLAKTHLASEGDKYPHRLSGGGKQRAQIARALATNAEILLMDEPLASLDALTKLTLQREIAALAAETGKTILYVTHDIVESAILSDRIVVLSQGPGSTIREALPNDLSRPRTIGDDGVSRLVRRLERIVLGGEADPG